MRRLLRHAPTALLALLGVLLLAAWVYAVDWSDHRAVETRDAAAAAGFGLALVAGASLLASANTRGAAERAPRFPPLWFGIALVIAAVAGGASIVYWDWLPAAEPFIAVGGLIGLFAAIGRLVTRWSRGGTVTRRTVARSTVWGMFVATGGALVLQLAFAAGALLAVFAGLAVVDTSLIDGFVDRVRDEGAIDNFSGGIVSTLTVALGISTMYAMVAPLTEEFTKLAGVALVLRGVAAGPYQTFVAGASVGLGFAVVETLGYALAAGSAWPWLLLLRAPVAFIHVTSTALASYGLYRQRTLGGYRLVPYFLAAVVVHGAWNALTVSAMLLSTQGSDPEQLPPESVLLVLVVVALLALLLTGCIAWTVMVARRLGRDSATAPVLRIEGEAMRHAQPPVIFERSGIRGLGS